MTSAFSKAMKRLSPSSQKKPTRPLWTPDDGITYSSLCKFIICRHRFWVRYVLGLQHKEDFNHRMEYGNLFHAGLEGFSRGGLGAAGDGIASYADGLLKRHPEDASQILFWKQVCRLQLAEYLQAYADSDGSRNYVLQETPFSVKLSLPSGRLIRIRGKFDEVFTLPPGKSSRKKQSPPVLVLQENKCKGDIDEGGIFQSLHADLQTMMYLTALNHISFKDEEESLSCWKDIYHHPSLKDIPAGLRPLGCHKVVYNVIQRPLGQKWSIRRKKTESEDAFLRRIHKDIQTRPKDYFKRWPMDVAHEDLTLFQQRYLFPILEQLLDWWESIAANPMDPWNTYYEEDSGGFSPDGFPINVGGKFPNKHHYCRPFGVYDGLAQGTRGDFFDFITSGGANKSGLVRAEYAFPELENPSLAGV